MQVAVFCSSSNNLAPIYYQEAKDLGMFLGKERFTLIYGGANKGLMESLAKNVKEGGGFVTGILPSYMRQQSSDFVDELLLVESLSERKQLLKEYADIFVVLPGGFGTLDELFDVLAGATVGEHGKKLIIVNSNGFYDSLLLLFDQFYTEHFANKLVQKHFLVVQNALECAKYLKDNEV